MSRPVIPLSIVLPDERIGLCVEPLLSHAGVEVGSLVAVTGRYLISKRVKRANMFRATPAWGLEVEHVDLLREYDPEGEILLSVDGEELLTASLPAFDRHSWERDFGFGRQRFLAVQHWRRHGEPAAPIVPRPKPTPAPRLQGSLFDLPGQLEAAARADLQRQAEDAAAAWLRERLAGGA